jgi:large subunit ribosomal protein L23
MTSLDRMYRVVRRPHVTEKATDDTVKRNAYHFEVPPAATKIEIRKAVERLFGVKVEGVNTIRVKGKWRRRGYTAGRSPEWKKAMVTLQEGQTIDVI